MTAAPAADRGRIGSGALNQQVAAQLREAAELLEQQEANPFRVSAYHRAAETGAGLCEDVGVLLEREGTAGLDALPGIGPEGQRTVVTETRGRLKGHRVVRGREAECIAGSSPEPGQHRAKT